jgi:hypothetical protein
MLTDKSWTHHPTGTSVRSSGVLRDRFAEAGMQEAAE